MKGQRMSFIIVWKVAGELHSPKNMTRGSNSPWFMEKAAFHSSPSFSQTLLKPQQRSKVVNHSTSRSLVSTSETSGSGWEFGIGMKLYGMVPCLMRGEMGKGFFREDICEVFVVLWNGTLRWMDLLSPGLFCKSLRGGQRGADAFLPFRSEKDHVNHVLLSKRRRGGGLSWWGIGFGQNTPVAAGGASCH